MPEGGGARWRHPRRLDYGERTSPGARVIAVHLVWGATTVWVGERLARQRSGSFEDMPGGTRLEAFRELPWLEHPGAG